MVSLQKGYVMFVIGIDPHKGSQTAAVLDDGEQLIGQLRVTADRWQRGPVVAIRSAANVGEPDPAVP